jgi:hypothetical protein
MALKWIEGFEAFGASGDPGGMDAKYSVTNITFYTMVSGRFVGGNAIEMDGSGNNRHFRTPNIISTPTMVVGFAFYNPGSSGDRELLEFFDGDAVLGMNIRLLSTNEYQVRRGTTVLASTSGAGVTGAWHYIEFKVVTDDSTGSYELRIGGFDVLSDSGIDTKANAGGASDHHASFRFNSAIAGGRIDDVYCDDSDFVGDHKVVTIFPDAAGDDTDFTPNTGANFQAVDDKPHDSDSTYVESGTTDDQDLYGVPTPTGVGTIVGVQHNIVCRKTDATDFDIKPVCKSGATESVDSAQTVNSTSYDNKRRILEADPDTASAWDAAGLGTAQFGYRVG